MRLVKVIFEDSKYNYLTYVNGSDDEIYKYFVNQTFDVENDNSQTCIKIQILN